MNIDAHQHFWNYTADDYPWISSGMERLAHNYLPPHLIKITQPHNITGSVAVQARQSTHETEWLLQLADEHNFIRDVMWLSDLDKMRWQVVMCETLHPRRYPRIVVGCVIPEMLVCVNVHKMTGLIKTIASKSWAG